jgi:hypothetical protein
MRQNERLLAKMSSHESSSDSNGAGKPDDWFGSKPEDITGGPSTDLSNLPMPGGVYAVWSPEAQKDYANNTAISATDADGDTMEKELVVKSGPPAKLVRCDNGAVVEKSVVLKKIDDYVKGVLASDITKYPGMLEDDLTHVNVDIARVHSEPDGSHVLEDIYQKYCAK